MGFFLDYLQKQKSIYAEDSTVYNVHQSKNGGFAVVCYPERKVEVYYLEKKNKIDSERIFMLNWIFKKLEQEDEAELKLKKTQKEDSDKSLPKNEISNEIINRPAKSLGEIVEQIDLEKNTPNHFLKTPQNSNQNSVKEGEKNKYLKLNGEIIIYTQNSPCAICMDMYKNIENEFPNIKVKVLYSKLFRFTNPNILYNYQLSSTSTYKKCKRKFKKSYSNEEFLSCINSETIEEILTNRNKFKQVSLNSSYMPRIKALYNILKIN